MIGGEPQCPSLIGPEKWLPGEAAAVREVTEIGTKVDEIKILEKLITNLQSERAEVAFYIFTNGSQTLEMNLTTRWPM